MIETIRKIISNILQALYQPFFFALAMAVLIMFFVMFTEKYGQVGPLARLRQAAKEWKDRFKTSSSFRRGFILVFVTVMIAFKTLLNRDMWANPLSDIIGIWGLHNKKGEFTTEVLENIAMFVPFIFFLFFYLEKTRYKLTSALAILWKSVAISLGASFTIEFLQLFLRLGTWQISDLCFNTAGGLLGGAIYMVYYLIRRPDKKKGN